MSFLLSPPPCEADSPQPDLALLLTPNFCYSEQINTARLAVNILLTLHPTFAVPVFLFRGVVRYLVDVD